MTLCIHICSSDLQGHLEGIEEHISRQKQALREASAKHQVSEKDYNCVLECICMCCVWITECLLFTLPGLNIRHTCTCTCKYHTCIVVLILTDNFFSRAEYKVVFGGSLYFNREMTRTLNSQIFWLVSIMFDAYSLS